MSSFICRFAFTNLFSKKRYNATEHPIPFHKAQDLGKIPKKLVGGPAPDLEEAYVREISLLYIYLGSVC